MIDTVELGLRVAAGVGLGATISGLNTAAPLWASAAVGSLAGAGMFAAAGAGTVAVIAANVLLRPLSRALDRNRAAGYRVRRDGVSLRGALPGRGRKRGARVGDGRCAVSVELTANTWRSPVRRRRFAYTAVQ